MILRAPSFCEGWLHGDAQTVECGRCSVELVVLSLLTLIASFIAGVAGFGFAVFLMGFFPLMLGVKFANVLVSLTGIATAVYLLVPLWRKIHWGAVARVLVGTAIGIPAGVWVLVKVDDRVLTIGLGIFILLYVLYEVLFRHRIGKKVPLYLGFGAGFLGGAFSGAVTAGGPPVVAFLSSLDLDKNRTKATILAYIVAASFYKLFFLLYFDFITSRVLMYTALLLGPTFIGMFAGKSLFNRLSTDTFRRVVLGILFGAAVFIIVKGLLGQL
jgi:uncharacterized membrane protein YfcA